MKQKLRVGERYALSKHKRKQTTIRYFSLLAVLTSMCLYAVKQVSAQQAEPAATAADIKPLQIGDTIPGWLWHLPLQVVNHSEGKGALTLNDYRDKKLIILEFWGSRCPPCIKAVDEIHILSKLFNDDFAALPILTHSKLDENTVPFMRKRGWTLPSVVGDTLLDRRIFSRYLSDWGDVWLFDGRLLAVPKRGYLNAETIRAALENQEVRFINKRNVPPIDPESPIFTGEKRHATEGYVSYYLPDYECQRFVAMTKSDSTILYAWNLPVDELYFEAYSHEIHPHLTKHSGIRWMISDTLFNYLFKAPAPTGAMESVIAREEWRHKTLFGYELRTTNPILTAYSTMQDDLNLYFGEHLGLQATIENISPQRYAVLRLLSDRSTAESGLTATTSDRKVRNTENVWAYDNYPKGHLYLHIEEALRNVPGLALTIGNVVDSTGIANDFLVTFEFPKSVRREGNIEAIQRVLRKYGLYLTIEEKAVPVLVVRQRGYKDNQFTLSN